MRDKIRHLSFEPIVDSNTQVLILGSLPGKKSLELSQYYGHPRNRIWKILSHITGNKISSDYKDIKIHQCPPNGPGITVLMMMGILEKFNFPFIIAVKGISKKKIIEQMRKRVLNTENVEFENAISEIHKIAKIRIQEIDFET